MYRPRYGHLRRNRLTPLFYTLTPFFLRLFIVSGGRILRFGPFVPPDLVLTLCPETGTVENQRRDPRRVGSSRKGGVGKVGPVIPDIRALIGFPNWCRVSVCFLSFPWDLSFPPVSFVWTDVVVTIDDPTPTRGQTPNFSSFSVQ